MAGFMSGNPYYSGSAAGSAIDGLIEGWTGSNASADARQKAAIEEEYKRQQIAQSQAQEQRIIDEQARKEAETTRLNDLRSQFVNRMSPQQTPLVGQSNELTPAGRGLMPQGLMGDIPQTITERAPAEARQQWQDVANPLYGQQQQAMQMIRDKGSIQTPAAPLTQAELLKYGMQGDANMNAAITHYQTATQKDKLPLSEAAKIFTPESIAAWQTSGDLKDLQRFEKPDKAEKIKWLDAGDKLVATDAITGEPTGRTMPKAASPNTVLRIDNRPERSDVAQSTFVDPKSGLPLVYDKKTGSYRVATVAGGGDVAPKPNAMSPEAATRAQQLETIISGVPKIRSMIFDANGNVDKTDIFNATVGTPLTKGREIGQQVKRTIEQTLRIATGAAAPDSEVKSYMKMYSPQIGDTNDMVRQKMDALEAFASGALAKSNVGRGANSRGNAAPAAAPNKPRTVLETRVKNGKVYTKYSDGTIE